MLDLPDVVGVRADSHGIVTSEVACAATAFLVWDMLIHLDQEVMYVWQGPNGWAKWMYISIRHVPYLAQGSILTLVATAGHVWKPAQCKAWIAYQLAVNEVLTIAVEIILIIRIYAMFNRNMTILMSVCALFVAEITAMCSILGITIPKIEFTSQCLITSTPKLFPSYWTISLVFETTLFILTLVKFAATVLRRKMRPQSIMFMLMKDGTWAYAIIFAAMLLNTLMYDIQKNTLAGICYFWELSVMSFAGSHVLLNLRRLAKKSSIPSTHSSVPVLTSLSELQLQATDEEITVTEMQTLRS